MRKVPEQQRVVPVVKHTKQGNGKAKTSSMNKYERRSYKKYRGQGR